MEITTIIPKEEFDGSQLKDCIPFETAEEQFAGDEQCIQPKDEDFIPFVTEDEKFYEDDQYLQLKDEDFISLESSYDAEDQEVGNLLAEMEADLFEEMANEQRMNQMQYFDSVIFDKKMRKMHKRKRIMDEFIKEHEEEMEKLLEQTIEDESVEVNKKSNRKKRRKLVFEDEENKENIPPIF